MRRRWYWLLVAVALFALVTLLMLRSPRHPMTGRTAPSDSEFPRYATPADIDREQRRRTLPASIDSPDAAEAIGKRDPLLVAMAPQASTQIIMEVGAVLSMPLGRALVDCLLGEKRDELPDANGPNELELLSTVERIAVSGPLVIVSAPQGLSSWTSYLEGRDGGTVAYENGRIYETEGGRKVVAIYGDTLALFGRDIEDAKTAIDRLEGREQAAAPIPMGEAYGEIYGRVSGNDATALLPDEVPPDLRAALRRIEFHVDASQDLLLVADLHVEGTKVGEDLARSLAGALAIARAKARADGETDLAEALDLARVVVRGQGLRLEAAFPFEFVLAKLCHNWRGDGSPGASADR